MALKQKQKKTKANKKNLNKEMKSLSSFFLRNKRKYITNKENKFFFKKKEFGKRKLEPTYKIQRREKDFF